MAKISCVFIDHQYHQKTKSTQFLKELLAESMDVTEYYFSSFSKEEFQGLIETKFDLYVAFQYDFIASFLLANKKKVLVVPMYDGTGESHILHWLVQKDALFLDYSENLYRTHTKLGMDAIHQHYFPEASSNKPVVNYDGLRYFFWERQPSSGLSVRWLAEKLAALENKPSHVHIHLAADPGEYSSIHESLVPGLFPYAKVTTSTWFASKADFEKCLTKFNVYVAPRMVEGIGFSFLDAMRKGLFIFGLDYPTLNEYVSNGETGCLFDSLATPFPELSNETLKRIGTAGFYRVVKGRAEWADSWVDCEKRIINYVHEPLRINRFNIDAGQAEKLAYYFFNAYQSYLAMLAKIYASSHDDSDIFVQKLAKLPLMFRLEEKLNSAPVMKAHIEFAASKFKKFFYRSY